VESWILFQLKLTGKPKKIDEFSLDMTKTLMTSPL
jgi:hypothetical protein